MSNTSLPISESNKTEADNVDNEPASKQSRQEDYKKAKELGEDRKTGNAPAVVDEEGLDINPHLLQYISTEVETKDTTIDDTKEKKKYKYGIVYMSYVPEGLNVKLLREIFSQFGDVGRIYLAPDKDAAKRKSKHKREYQEGWIEFKKKRIAKQVAKTMNGTALNFARRSCKLNGQVWSLKYLHRFKWTNLTEDIIHAKAVRDQRLRFEIGQAKKQVNFYQKMSDRSSRMKHSNKPDDEKDERDATYSKTSNHFYQNQPYQEEEAKVNIAEDLLSQIFKRTS